MLDGLSLVILKGMPFSRIDWRRKMLIAVDRFSGHYNGGISPQTAGKAGIETKTETNESTDFSVFDDILDSMRTNNDMKDLSNERTWFAIRAYVTGYGPITNRRPLAAAGVSQLLEQEPRSHAPRRGVSSALETDNRGSAVPDIGIAEPHCMWPNRSVRLRCRRA